MGLIKKYASPVSGSVQRPEFLQLRMFAADLAMKSFSGLPEYAIPT